MAGIPVAPELVADIEEAFLGYWPDDLVAVFSLPYEPGALLAYAHRDNGQYLPADEDGPA